MNNRHPSQLKKSKSLEPFWSYQLCSTADLADLANVADLANLAFNFEVNGLDWHCCLAGCSKRAPWVPNIYLMCVHNMFWAWNFHLLNWQFNEQSFVILWVSWCKNKLFWKRFTCTNSSSTRKHLLLPIIPQSWNDWEVQPNRQLFSHPQSHLIQF